MRDLPAEAFIDTVITSLDQRIDQVRDGPIYRSGGLGNFSEPERIVFRAYWAMGIIQNGGFQYFYEGATNAAEVSDAFQALGFSQAAEACRLSLSIFPGGVPPEDDDERLDILAAYQGFRNAFFRPLNEAVWEAGDTRFKTTLANYVRDHSADFAGDDSSLRRLPADDVAGA